MTGSRKEAIRAFKERKPARGVFAVRCVETGAVWVGAFPNLEAMRNRLWFTLRQGGHSDRALQAEWNSRGEGAFRYEVLETLEDEVPALAVADALSEKKREWSRRLGGSML